MSKTASISIDSFDPEVLAAAREVAKRAGVPLESWIESVTGPAQPAAGGKPAEAASEAAPAQPESKPPEAPAAAPVDASLAAMMRRLDALDRSLNEEREASKNAAARMIGEIESRLATKLQPAPAPAGTTGEGLTGRLAEIERRMG